MEVLSYPPLKRVDRTRKYPVWTGLKVVLLAVFLLSGLLSSAFSQVQCPNSRPRLTNYSSVGYNQGATVNTTANLIANTSSTVSNMRTGYYYLFQVCEGSTYRFSTCGAPMDTQLSIYRDDNGSAVGGNDDNGPACGGLQASVDVVAPFTGFLRVQVDQFNCQIGSNDLNLPLAGTRISGPSNDVCTSATSISIGGTATGNTCCAAADVAPFCGTDDGTGGGVWYTFTGNGNRVNLSLCNSNYDTKLRVYTGSCASLTCEAGTDDDGCGGSLQSELDFCTVSGTTYFVLVHGFRKQLADPTSLNITDLGNTAPTITCPGSQTVNNSAFQCGENVTYLTPTFSDDCGATLARIAGLASGSLFPVGTTTVTWRVTDNIGQTADCSFNITVNDVENPVASCPSDTTIGTDLGQCEAVFSYTSPTATDNCPGVSIARVSGPPIGGTFLPGDTTVTWRATDASGNTHDCSFEVTTVDDENPTVLNCPTSFSVDTDIDTCGANVSYSTPTATDNCPGVTISQFVGPAPGGFFPVGPTSVTWRAEDASGNTTDCFFDVTVVDTANPGLVCPGSVVLSNANTSCNQLVTGIPLVSAEDNCPIVDTTYTLSGATIGSGDDDASGRVFNVGVTTVEYTVSDPAGLTSSCTFTVTVNDTTTPTVICQDTVTYLDVTETATITPGQVIASSTDNCELDTTIVSRLLFACADTAGPVNVTVTATDTSGNMSSCIAQVTVLDTAFFCCSPVTVSGDGKNDTLCVGVDSTLSVSLVGGVDSLRWQLSTNNGSSWTLLFDSNPTYNGTTTEDLTIVNPQGSLDGNLYRVLIYTCLMTLDSSVADTIRVDPVPPTAVCKDITFALDAAGNATVAADSVDNGSTDNCGITSQSLSQSSFTCSNVGANAVTLTVTDSNGNTDNCSATITIQDNTNPIAVCQNITLQLDASGNTSVPAAGIDGGSTDACGIAGFSASPSSLTCSNVGTNAVTLTVTDVNGNVGTCIASVTVQDTVPPTAICQNVTVQLDVAGNGTLTAAAVNNGSSDACGLAPLSVSPTNFNCSNIGPNTVTLTVTDVNGNVSTCTATATVEDNVVPVTVCQDITVQLNATGNASITADTIDNGSTDACGIANLSVAPNSFNCSNVGSNVVTLTVTDNNGNSATCTGSVTVEDTVPPVALCRNITIQLDGTGNATITADTLDNGSNDACGIQSLSAIPTSFTCANIGPNTVTLTVTDNNSNTATCTGTVTIQDTVSPVESCKDITLQLDATGNASISADTIDDGSMDACGIDTLTVSPNAFTCSNVGANTVTLTATDNNGNTATCTGTVTVQDTVSPVALCQNITVQLDASGNGSITAGDIDNGSNDACGIDTLTVTPNSFTCSDTGSNTVTLTATDNNGNTATCTATVTIEDSVPPTALCSDITLHLNASGNGSITPGDVDNGSSDACGIASLAVSPNSFTCSNVGPNTVTLTVTDNNGNVSTCTGTVTVSDSVSPVAICQNITIQLDVAGNASITAGDIDNGSNDACGIDTLTVAPNTFTCSNVGANTVTLTVTDNNGNVSTCTGTVTVEDTIPPVALCQDITAQLDASGNATITAGDVDNGSSDACGLGSLAVSPNSFTCSNIGSNTVTLLVTDNNGNASSCTGTVTIQDTVSPVALCQNLTVLLDAAGNGAITPGDIDNGSSDACGIDTLAVAPNTFTCSNVGANTVTLTVTDNNGNVSTCTGTVTVQDTVSPVAICQNITVQLDPAGNATITAGDIDNGSSDACGIDTLTVAPNTFTCSNVGANTATLTVTDNNGNTATCTGTVTIEDTVPPTAVCQDLTVFLDASGNGTITAGDIDNGSSDACGISSLAVSPNTFNCSNIGPNTSTLTVTDNNGNVSTCTGTVTIQDTVSPVALCQNLTVFLDASGNASITPGDIDNGSNDACGIDTLTAAPNSFTCSNVGANTVTLTVTDNNGNTATCTGTVTVEDSVPPVAICQDITLQLDATGNASITAGDIDNGSSDACGLDTLTVAPTSFTCSNVGANTVTLTVTDNNGNTATCTGTVTVEDTVPPVAICQDITVQLDASGNASITAGDIDNGSSDACGIDTLTATPTSFNCTNVGANTVSLTVTDNNGNTATCTGAVTVEDSVPPVAICQDITVQLSASGNASITAGDIDNGSSDACGIDTLTVTPTSFTCSNVGANTVTLTVTDNNGNSATCTGTVTVEDSVPPVAICQDITVQLSASGNASITAGDIDNGSSDACGIDTLTVTPNSFTCSNVGANTVTLTVTDNNGNSATCTGTVTVEDTVPPVAICQDITVQLSASGNASITAGDIDNGSSDACGIDTLTVTPTSFTCSNVGANTVTLTATDNNGNTATCTGTVTVEDSVPPVAICQDITVQLSASGNASITAGDIDNGSSDACGIDTLTVTPTSFTCSNVGANTVTLTVTDNNGNTATCTGTVTVEDTVPPVAICQDITVQLDASGNASITAGDIDNGSSDACGIDTLTVTPNSFTCSNVGANTVTLTVTDNNGNTATCTGTVTVEDSVPPVAICQDITVQLSASGNASITAGDIDNGSNDACGMDTLTVTPSSFTCSNVGANTVTLTVTDNNGNSATCTGTVTVEDTVPPVAICQDITVQLDASGNATITANDVDNGSNDACGIDTLTVAPNTFTCSNVGSNSVTLTVTDNNGNVSSCGATVTVEDTVPPVAICQDITVQL